MTEPDWEGAYRELEAAHIELWRWARVFSAGLRAGGSHDTAEEIERRFGNDNPFAPWTTVQAIRKGRLGLEEGGPSYCAQCQRPFAGGR